MSSRPRKAPAKKAVSPKVATSPALDDPQTPYYDARADDGTFAEEAHGARGAEAVAEAQAGAGHSPAAGPAGGVEPGVVLLTDDEKRHIEEHVIPAAVAARRHCSECTATEHLTTVGKGDAARDYCPKHKPINA